MTVAMRDYAVNYANKWNKTKAILFSHATATKQTFHREQKILSSSCVTDHVNVGKRKWRICDISKERNGTKFFAHFLTNIFFRSEVFKKKITKFFCCFTSSKRKFWNMLHEHEFFICVSQNARQWYTRKRSMIDGRFLLINLSESRLLMIPALAEIASFTSFHMPKSTVL